MHQITHQWNPKLYNDKHAFVHEYGTSLVEILNPKKGERILDLGSGSGELTHMIWEKTNEVIGMDSSLEMVEDARSRYPYCKFEVGDASDFQFIKPFDVIFSNATLHWVTNYEAAMKCMYRNLVKGGRLVLEFGGKGNIQKISQQLRKSLKARGYVRQSNIQLWYFPSIGEYTSQLEKVGFSITSAQWYERPTKLSDTETGIIDWLTMFCKPFMEDVKTADVDVIMNEVKEKLKPELYRNGNWFADYKRIRITAFR